MKAASDALALLLLCAAFVVVLSWTVALSHVVERIAARALLFNGNINLKNTNGDISRTQLAESSAASKDGPPRPVVQRFGQLLQAATEQRRRMTAACVIVLLTFPARAALELLTAVSFFSTFNADCTVRGPCQSDAYLISIWMRLTPEFRPTVVSLSSPLPIVLSLWLVTKAHAQKQPGAAEHT